MKDDLQMIFTVFWRSQIIKQMRW